jgi:hypothetical protein
MIKVFEIISSNAACADFDAFCVRASGARLVNRGASKVKGTVEGFVGG